VRKKTFIFIIFLFTSLSLQAYIQTHPDEKLFQEAKLLIFDKEWRKAQEKLEELLDRYPRSHLAFEALFYKAKCLENQKGKEVEAFYTYKSYLLLKGKNESLAEESEISIIELAYELYEKGKRSYLNEIEKRLSSLNKVIKYFAAIKLSLVKDKKRAIKGVPVLKEIIRKERDDELRDRAKIALLRIDPDALKDIEEEIPRRKFRVLKMEVIDKRTKKAEFSLAVPWALADLALSAISEEDKAALRKEGYDLDKIMDELIRGKDILEIKGENKIFRIWIE
jgi:hypothetical protein